MRKQPSCNLPTSEGETLLALFDVCTPFTSTSPSTDGLDKELHLKHGFNIALWYPLYWCLVSPRCLTRASHSFLCLVASHGSLWAGRATSGRCEATHNGKYRRGGSNAYRRGGYHTKYSRQRPFSALRWRTRFCGLESCIRRLRAPDAPQVRKGSKKW